MVILGSAGGGGSTLSVTMSVCRRYLTSFLGEASHVLYCCLVLLMENSNPEASVIQTGQFEGQRRDRCDIFFSPSVWSIFVACVLLIYLTCTFNRSNMSSLYCSIGFHFLHGFL